MGQRTTYPKEPIALGAVTRLVVTTSMCIRLENVAAGPAKKETLMSNKKRVAGGLKAVAAISVDDALQTLNEVTAETIQAMQENFVSGLVEVIWNHMVAQAELQAQKLAQQA